MLSNTYKDIHLFRFDEQVGDVYILAGEALEIVVPPNGFWIFIRKPNFEEMDTPSLRAYVLENRNDLAAMRTLFSRRTPNSKVYPPMYTKDGQPIKENIRLAEEEDKRKKEQN